VAIATRFISRPNLEQGLSRFGRVYPGSETQGSSGSWPDLAGSGPRNPSVRHWSDEAPGKGRKRPDSARQTSLECRNSHYHRGVGAIAQLGERLLCKQEVAGSIPAGSMEESAATRWFLSECS
jgi:hypothetical protein